LEKQWLTTMTPVPALDPAVAEEPSMLKIFSMTLHKLRRANSQPSSIQWFSRIAKLRVFCDHGKNKACIGRPKIGV
jgi:hypothetical protein